VVSNPFDAAIDTLRATMEGDWSDSRQPENGIGDGGYLTDQARTMEVKL